MTSRFTARPEWPASASKPLASPLQPAVVYTTDGPDEIDAIYEGRAAGYTYSREGHPNAVATAGLIDRLEGATDGCLTGSGMAAVTAALLGSVQAGGHVVGGDQLYGRSLRLLHETLPGLGIETSLADPTSAANVAEVLRPNTKLVLIETVSNPTIRVADVAGIAALCQERGILLAVDNTFATPRTFRPFEHGADIVIHSVTKILSGHSDTMLGYVAARDPAVMERIETFIVTTGMTPSPFDCWLAERGLLTFPLRFDRAEANAARLADFLGQHPLVSTVLYPTRAGHPDEANASKLLGERGSHMVSFALSGDRHQANAFSGALADIPFAPTLGDVTTTFSHPATSSHRGLTVEERAQIGITETFFRVSVGCEEPEPLLSVFETALGELSES